jgi:hypothetical protein
MLAIILKICFVTILIFIILIGFNHMLMFCMGLFFSVLIASGNEVYRRNHPHNTLYIGVLGIFYLIAHIVTAHIMDWDILSPPPTKGVSSIPYYLAIIMLLIVVFDIFIMRRFPALAKKIYLAAFGNKIDP